MSKKSKRTKRLPGRVAQPQIFQRQISHAQHQILQGDFAGTITTCEPLLRSLPRRSSLYAEVLSLLGLAHGMLQHYEESYDLFTEALTINPTNAELWYNHGLACHYTTRLGQAVGDFERAVALSRNDNGEVARKFATQLAISRRELEEAMQEQGEHITREQYVERETAFMQAMSLMRHGQWQEAEQAFRQIIEMGGRLPQYWGNLGVSLTMQARYTEAEAALKRALAIDPQYALARDNLAKIPEVQRAGGPLGIELRDLSQVQDVKQSIAFYKQNDGDASTTTHTTIEKDGNTLKRSRSPIGKQPPRYRFFLNPYQDERFTTCPQCQLKTRQRKFPLVIHVHPMHTIILGKTCRYCVNCDLLIAHQDQLEEQLAGYFSIHNPEIIGNDYLVMGTLDRPEWRKGIQDPLSVQEMVEHLHDFKEVLIFKPAYPEAHKTTIDIVPKAHSGPGGSSMAKRSTSEQVPKDMQARFDEITQLTDAFSQAHLNDEYASLLRQLTAALCRKRPSPLSQGKVPTWACAIIHAVGTVNFLFDSSQTPYVPARQIASSFDLSMSTMQARSKQIRDLFDMYQMDPKWTLPSMIDQNPLVWMLEINGLIIDVRHAPREIQEEAFRRGLIPYIPGR